MARLDIRLLGPLELRRGGEPVALGPYKQRAVLAALLVTAPEPVSIDGLIDRLWGDSIPKSAGHALRVYVSNLRKALEPERAPRAESTVLVTCEPGYRLDLPPDATDAARFETLVASADELAAADGSRALRQLEDALALWRGPALADFADQPWAVPLATRLDGMRLTATERRFDIALDLDRHSAVVDELEATAASHPLREHLWAQVMTALYRCGRQADALRAYARVRQHLAEELGLEPGPELRSIETAVLTHDASIAGPAARSTVVPDGPAGPVAPVVPGASGAPAEPSPPTVEVRDEHRVATALFADIVGSTPLGEAVDADEYKLVIAGAIQRMVAACADVGGRVVQIAGDGVLALFGAPVAHEDDADRAVLAGLQIVDDLHDYGDDVAHAWGVEPLRARVGINTGPVVTGATGGGDIVEYTALGDSVNTAARLETAADPGTVLVAEATRAAVGPDFTWSDPHMLSLRGKAEPVVAHAVTGGRPGGRRRRGLPGRDTPLVGRDRELALAAEAITEVHAGRGGILLIGGEAGLGKSRLLGELRRHAVDTADPARPVAWLEAHCLSYGESHPLWPIREALHSWIGTTSGQPEMRVRVALRRAVNALGAEGDPYPTLAAALGVDQAAAATLGGPEQRGAAIGRGLRTVVAALARDRPVIIAVDDLHWSDPGTLDVLESLLPLTEREPVLVVLAGRPEPDHGSWRLREHVQRSPRARTVDIAPLPDGDDGGLLDLLVGPSDLPDTPRVEILDRAEGNPFYLEEIVRSLVSDGVLAAADDGYRYVGPHATVRLPDTVEQIIVSRIDRLPVHCRDVLLAASAVGRQFSRDLLAELVDRPHDLDGALLELERRALVREHRRWPERELRFIHALIQEAAYGTLVGRHRRDLHRRIALALGGRPERLADAARHWELAGDDAAALDAYVAAGMAELDSPTGFYLVALPLMERAVVLSERMGTPLDPLVEAHALVLLALRTVVEGEHRGRRPLLLQALGKARASGDPRTIARVLSRLAIDEANDLELEAARARAGEAMELARGIGDHAVWIPALDARKLVQLYLGELELVRDTHDELEGLLEVADAPVDQFRHWLHAEAAVIALAEGDGEAALHRIEAALALARPPIDDDYDFLAAMLAVDARIRRALGRYDEALARAREACRLIEGKVHLWWERWTAAEYGALLLELCAYERAVEVLRPVVAAGPSPMPSQEIRCAGMLALAGVRVDDAEAAVTGAEAFEALAASMRLPEGMAYLYGADGQLAFAEACRLRGDLDAARAVAAPIAAAADDAGWLNAAAHAHLVLGSLALARDDRETASTEHTAALERAGAYPGLRWRALAGLAAATGSEERLDEARRIITRLFEPCAGDPEAAPLATAL